MKNNTSFSIAYQAKTVEEFRQLMEEFGDKAVPTVSKPEERGPNETAYLEASKKSRLRLTIEEQGRVDRHEATRESIAAERLDLLQNPMSSDAVMEGPVSVASIIESDDAPKETF